MKFYCLQEYSVCELKERFDLQGEARGMDFDAVVAQVCEMRNAEPDNINMTDAEIAAALQS